jgi:two-component system sensor histidine kinase EvgS
MIVSGKRILLVDDMADVRFSARMLLEVDNHEVTEAANAKTALELFEPGKFDLVITDWEMPPGINGSELTNRIKQLAPQQPVIILTAWPERIVRSETPPDGVIMKPYLLEDLRRQIARLFG